MARLTDCINCCGIMELSNIANDDVEDHSAEQMVQSACYGGRPPSIGYVFFSDAEYTKYRHGLKLAAYIKEKKLGKVAGVRPTLNPNSGNMIRMWVWTPNRDNLRVWLQGQKGNR